MFNFISLSILSMNQLDAELIGIILLHLVHSPAKLKCMMMSVNHLKKILYVMLHTQIRILPESINLSPSQYTIAYSTDQPLVTINNIISAGFISTITKK